MAQHEQPRRRTAPTGAVGVALVLALAGLIFATNARIAAATPEPAQDFPGLVQAEIERLEVLSDEVSELRTEVEALTDSRTDVVVPGPDEELIAFWAGRRPAVGPGLTVTLTDAPATGALPAWVTPNDLVIHQQDLQAVINALWAGGAEAMTLQGERVIATSAFRCVGNVLLLHGRHFSPPYVVQAIGDPEALEASLLADPQVQVYLDYVDAVGLGWKVSASDNLLLPARTESLSLTHAAPVVDAA